MCVLPQVMAACSDASPADEPCSPACDPNAVCADVASEPTCLCLPGYVGDGRSCAQVSDAGDVDAGNLDAGDVDECAANTDECLALASCTNVVGGSYTCLCPTGYSGDGRTQCNDIDECMAASSACGSNETCTNTAGSYTCACSVGYVMGALGCVPDVDECATNADDCDPNATCTNTNDGFTCACLPGYSGPGTTCSPGICNPATDADTGTVTFTLDHMGIPASTGFDIDGIDNSPAPGGMGLTTAGCNMDDQPAGIDNAIRTIASSLAAVVDLNAAVQAVLAPSGGTLTLTITLDHLSSAANDPCVGVHLTASTAGGSTTTLDSSGALVNGVLGAAFTDDLSFPLSFDVPAAACTNSVCLPGTLALRLHKPRLALTLDAAHTMLMPGSLLGAFVFHEDCTGGTPQPSGACSGGTYAASNPMGIADALRAWAAQVQLQTSYRDLAIVFFGDARDLHMGVDGALSPCSFDGQKIDRNAISIGFSID